VAKFRRKINKGEKQMKKFKQKSLVLVLALLCAVLLGTALVPLLAQGIKRAFAATSNGNALRTAGRRIES